MNEFIKKRVAITIHAFAVAHAATAFICAQLVLGDKALLTGLTIAMIITLANICDVDMDRTLATTLASLLVAEFIGVYGAMLLVQLIPFVGNAANAAVTFTVTETIGWALFKLFGAIGNNADKIIWSSLTPTEKKRMIKDALKDSETIAKEEHIRMKKLLKKLSHQDRSRYKNIQNQLRKLDKNDIEERELLMAELTELLNKYDY